MTDNEMTRIDWDDLEEKALEAFNLAYEYRNDTKYLNNDQRATYTVAVGTILQGIAALRAQRLAEEKGDIRSVSVTKFPERKGSNTP